MKLLHYLHKNSPRLFWLALLTATTSGLVNVGLVGLISRRLLGGGAISNNFIFSLIGLIILAALLDYGAKQTLNRLISFVVYELRLQLAIQILATPFPQLETIGAPRLLALLTEDVRSISQIVNALPIVSIAGATAVGCVLYLGWLSPWILLALLVAFTPLVFIYTLLHRRAVQDAAIWLAARSGLFVQYHTLIDGIKELLLHRRRRGAFYNKLLQPTFQELEEKAMVARHSNYLGQSVNQFTYFILIVVLFAVQRQLQAPPSVLAAYALIMLYLKTATMNLFSTLPQWTEASGTIRQIEALGFLLVAPAALRHELEATPPPEPKATTPLQIELRNVTYQYRQVENDERAFHVGPFDLSLRAGELVFVIGGNGSGKTTLLKLLTGLYLPADGAIYWNGLEVCAANIEAYRQNFTTVFAEPFLFEQLLGLEHQQLDEQAQAWLQQLQLAHKVRVVDGQLSTVDLSHGQRKRLALLTAYLEDRPVYIFDEWAAGQDPEFRALFYQQFLPALRNRGKLVIAITHDDHYFPLADRLLKLDFGRIEQDVQSAAPRNDGSLLPIENVRDIRSFMLDGQD